MKKLSLLIGLTMVFGICHAQDELPIVVPDRPGFTYGAAVVQHHKITWDNGFAFESMPDGERTVTLNSTMLRYGLFENMELRLGSDFLLSYDGLEPRPTFGVGPLTAGVKFKLNEGHGIIPTVGFLAELKSPHVGTKEQLPSHLAPAMYAIFEHAIGERFWLCYNAGLEWDGETAALPRHRFWRQHHGKPWRLHRDVPLPASGGKKPTHDGIWPDLVGFAARATRHRSRHGFQEFRQALRHWRRRFVDD